MAIAVVRAGVLLLGLCLASCAQHATSARTTQAERLPPPTCAGWFELSSTDRLVVVGSALQREVGRPESSPLAGCLWSIYDQIADHTGAICTKNGGGSFDEASNLAFSSAVDFCSSRVERSPSN